MRLRPLNKRQRLKYSSRKPKLSSVRLLLFLRRLLVSSKNSRKMISTLSLPSRSPLQQSFLVWKYLAT